MAFKGSIQSTENKAYYLKYISFLNDGANIALLEKLKQSVPNGDISAHITNNKHTIIKLKKQCVIINPQFDLLFPTSGLPDPSNFDITLLTCLLRSTCLNTYSSVWDPQTPPSATDLSVEADVARIRNLRNEYIGHPKNTELTKAEFEAVFSDTEKVLLRLGSTVPDFKSHIYGYKTKSIDPLREEELLKEVSEWKDKYETMAIKQMSVEVPMAAPDSTANKEEAMDTSQEHKPFDCGGYGMFYKVPMAAPDSTANKEEAMDTSQDQSVGSVDVNRAREKFFEEFTQTRIKSQFEGRILDINESLCENTIRDLKLKPFDCGGYGMVYKVSSMNDKEMSIVIKKIQCDVADKLRSATCEILAARLMHFGIVPLWASAEALAEATNITTFYFILPYMENESLAKKLFEDKKAIESHRSGELTLDKEKRLRILYQVACALAFLHEKIPNFRESYVHRDVTTRNIVLDSKFNARLVDFGLAREYTPGKDGVTMRTSDLLGVPGYFRTHQPDTLTVGKDVFNFGIVILEVLSSHPPYWEQHSEILLRKKLDDGYFIEDFKTHIQVVWGQYTISDNMEPVNVKKLMEIATKCRKETITSAVVRDALEGQIRDQNLNHWDDPQAGRNVKTCVICLINPVIQDAQTILAHNEKCNLHVCATCMRNSYLNPIECHSCATKVQPTIGHQWEAILVAGNDVDDKDGSAVTFKKDVDKVFKAITSRHPMAMGISKESVHRVYADEPGTSQKLLPKLKEKFDHVAKQKIHSLLFYFTGHHRLEKGFKLGDDDEHLTSKELEEYIEVAVKKSVCKRVLVLLDCCEAPKLRQERSDSYYQINSCNETQETKFLKGEGSLMTEFFVQSLKGKSSEDQCLLQKKLTQTNPNQEQTCELCTKFKSENGFMKIDNLHENVQKHVNAYDKHLQQITHDITNHFRGQHWKEAVFAYFIDSLVTFEFTLVQYPNSSNTPLVVVNQLPESHRELKEKLFIAYREKLKLPKLKPDDFSDMLAIMFLTGPRHSNKHELKTMEMIEAAWNGKRQLCVGLREIQNLHNGKVGVFRQAGDASAVLKCFDNEDVNKLCERPQPDSTVLVTSSLEEGGARKLWRAVSENAAKRGADEIWKAFEKQLEAIKDNKMIEGKGKLVFTFQENDEDGNQITNFYSIHVEM